MTILVNSQLTTSYDPVVATSLPVPRPGADIGIGFITASKLGDLPAELQETLPDAFANSVSVGDFPFSVVGEPVSQSVQQVNVLSYCVACQ